MLKPSVSYLSTYYLPNPVSHSGGPLRLRMLYLLILDEVSAYERSVDLVLYQGREGLTGDP